MNHPFLKRILALLWLAALLVTPAGAFAQSGAPEQKVLVDAGDLSALAALKAEGAQMLADYQSFSLWRLPATGSASPMRAALELQPVDDAIYLRGLTLNPAASSGVQAQSALPGSGSGFWMVQMIGPVKQEWYGALLAARLEVAAYLPNDTYVVWGDSPADKIATLEAGHPEIRWDGPYQPEYRLSPDLRGTTGVNPLDVTVQVYDHPGAQAVVDQLLAMAQAVYLRPVSIAGFIDLSVRLTANQASATASLPDVFDVEPWSPPQMMDEAQGQILAGNLTQDSKTGAVMPTGPGYLSWLASKGFPAAPGDYPIVDVVDDGIDTGSASSPEHPDFYDLGVKKAGGSRITAINNCTGDPASDSGMGHGNINAGIIAGYNALSGFPYADSNGYSYGLGISPYGRISGTKFFSNAGPPYMTNCGLSYEGLVGSSYANGAYITSDSWGDSSAKGMYTAASQAYDALTRDANPALAGNQPMLHIFSAGNEGLSGDSTITPPSTAKNVIAVGATENVRDNGVLDGCGVSSSGNADNVANFSSRGVTADGRAKPDLMAPGIHIQGPASQSPNYDKTGVPLEVCNPYYPGGQTLYTWSTGTSHSAPAVSGAAQLAYAYYQRVISPGNIPSPAMLKALLINATRYLTGASAGDTLPSPNQGWGGLDLGNLFDGTGRYVLDQTSLLTSTGAQVVLRGGVLDPGKPFRVTLVWTDAPGDTIGAAYKNNLDLEVSVGGQVYKGNNFNGAVSFAGGSFDTKNNVENVFLPAGLSGAFKIRVIAANLVADGVPGNGSLIDQDFALVIDNGAVGPVPSLSVTHLAFTPLSLPVGIPGAILPGDTVALSLPVANSGSATATGVTGSLAVVSGQVNLLSALSAYPDIAPGASAANLTAYKVQVSPAQACGTQASLTETIHAFPDFQSTARLSLPIGLYMSGSGLYSGPPVAIPNASAAGTSVTARLPNPSGAALDTQSVTVQLSVAHQFDGDLILTLTSPAGKVITLSSKHGGTGSNYTNTLFTDSASTAISAAQAPFTGSFKPDQPLASFAHTEASGDWKLTVVDTASRDTGAITAFSIAIRFATCNPAYYKALNKINLPVVMSP